jgi:homoserine dehydrogenase
VADRSTPASTVASVDRAAEEAACGAPGTIVLKFGSSVIPSEAALAAVVEEVARWRSGGWRVVAVVSAIGGGTDALLAHARRFGDAGDGHALAAYVATGELQAAALLGLALERAGHAAAVLDAAGIGLRTAGPALDATPRSVDPGAIERALERFGVVVAPGFIGRAPDGRTTLLGRGGSDLSALVIAGALRARCRLVKDVDGLYDRDPACAAAASGGAPARRFERATHDTVLSLDEGIVQHKAVRFAREAGLAFEVACLGARRGTIVEPAGAVA